MKMFLFTLLLFSCNSKVDKSSNKDFYSEGSGRLDVARFPIVEPYELKSAYCCENWNLDRFSKLGKVFKTDLEIDSIGYANQKIVIINNVLDEPHYYVLNLKDSTITDFKTRKSFVQFSNVKLYAMKDAYQYYKRNEQPPWGK
jgi:hypothetical protein